MIPITLKLKSFFPWLYFGMREVVRGGWDRLMFRGPRELQLVEHVEKHARAGDLEHTLSVIDAFAKKRFLMNVGIEKGAILDQALDTARPKRVLEMGCYCGYSAIRIARKLKATDGQMISLEKSAEFAGYARRVVAHAGLSDRVDIRVGSAAELIPTLTEPFDVIFIDHWKDAYLTDLKALEARGLLAKNAMVIADNVGIFENTLVPYLTYVRESGRYKSEHHVAPMEYFSAIDDGVEISIWQGAAGVPA